MYVIRNNDTGKYANWPGMKRSYTSDGLKAQMFRTREEAERNCCGNETIISL